LLVAVAFDGIAELKEDRHRENRNLKRDAARGMDS